MEEGSLTFPHLFMLAYEIFIHQLQDRAPPAHLFVYVGDIAVTTRTRQQMHDTIHAIQDIIPNAKNTPIYH